MVTKDHTYFNKPATKNLQVCLSMYDISLPPGIKGFRILSELSIPTFIFGLAFCFYSPRNLFRRITVEARLTVSWTERLLRYFYRIFTLWIAVLPCLKRKKTKTFRVFAPSAHRWCLQPSPVSSCHFTCLWHVCLVSQKNPDAPIFFCIISWLGVFNKTNTLFHARLMLEIFTLCKIIFNTTFVVEYT